MSDVLSTLAAISMAVGLAVVSRLGAVAHAQATSDLCGPGGLLLLQYRGTTSLMLRRTASLGRGEFTHHYASR